MARLLPRCSQITSTIAGNGSQNPILIIIRDSQIERLALHDLNRRAQHLPNTQRHQAENTVGHRTPSTRFVTPLQLKIIGETTVGDITLMWRAKGSDYDFPILPCVENAEILFIFSINGHKNSAPRSHGQASDKNKGQSSIGGLNGCVSGAIKG